MNDDDLKSQFAVLSERTEHIIKKIDEQRESTGKIFDKLDKLPCEAHHQKLNDINGKTKSNEKWIYGIVVAILGTAFFIIREVLAK